MSGGVESILQLRSILCQPYGRDLDAGLLRSATGSRLPNLNFRFPTTNILASKLLTVCLWQGGSAPACRRASPGTAEETIDARTPACGIHPLQ